MNRNLLQELLDSINRPSIFFIPREMMEKNTDEDFSELDILGLTNHLILIDREGKTKLLSSSTEGILILQKEELLKASIFELLKLKSEPQEQLYDYTIEKYLNKLDTWSRIFLITKLKAKYDTLNYKSEIQRFLDLQYNLITTHKKELETQLQLGCERIPLENNLPTINTTTSSKITAHQKLLPTIEEVDDILLKQVFNVDFTKFNTAPKPNE